MTEKRYRGPGRYSLNLGKSITPKTEISTKSNKITTPVKISFLLPQADVSSDCLFGAWRPVADGESINEKHVAIIGGKPSVPCRIYSSKPTVSDQLSSKQLIFSGALE